MPPSNPPRRFDVTPVETTHSSSKNSEESPKPRRFTPQPIETTTSSSRKHLHSPDKSEPPKARRFVPEVLEHSSTSTRSTPVQNEAKEEKKPVRRFAPQMLESSQGSTKSRQNSGKLKFEPMMLETTYRSNRGKDTAGKTPRKFEPILIDTASRSRRAENSTRSGWRTEDGFSLHAHEHQRHIAIKKSPKIASNEKVEYSEDDIIYGSGSEDHGTPFSGLAPGRRREIAPLDGRPPNRRLSLSSHRSHSFRLPELDTIESSESSEPGSTSSSVASSPGHHSPLTTSDSSGNLFSDATRRRESIEPEFAQYLLELQAKKQRKRLEQEALYAAFPTETVHEQVHHYINEEEDSDNMSIEERPVTFDPEDDMFIEMVARRESTARIPWEQLEMQRHAELLQQERNANKATAKKSSDSPWWVAPGPPASEKAPPGARPPMLGDELIFPRCQSPEPARFDVTQGREVLRDQMNQQPSPGTGQVGDGMWQAKSPQQPIPSIKTPSTSKTSTAKGLWGGFCVADGNEGLMSRQGPSGLMTPAPEPAGNPFEQAFAVPNSIPSEAIHIKTPLSGAGALARADLARLDGVLSAQADLDRVLEQEFPDSFVTQVYNYLSLGYPSLARPFDEELSKISKIPIADLRRDDQLARESPRGYIRLGSDFEGGGGHGLTEQSCTRWKALKSYIHEWARQEQTGKFGSRGEMTGYGIGVRRGSWAH